MRCSSGRAPPCGRTGRVTRRRRSTTEPSLFRFQARPPRPRLAEPTGDRAPTVTPDSLRSAETQTQGWLQFETSELILDLEVRDRVLGLMADQGRNRACGFVGAVDAVVREPDGARIERGIGSLLEAAAERGVPMGRLVGGDGPQAIEDAMVAAMEGGARLIGIHLMASDLPYVGAHAAAQPFFKAAARCGF